MIWVRESFANEVHHKRFVIRENIRVEGDDVDLMAFIYEVF